MKDHGLVVTERLAPWRTKYSGDIAEDTLRAATEFAADCFLAFDVRSDPRLEGRRWVSVPEAAIISATKFGDRPAFRPPSARPAEHAAHALKLWGLPNAIVHDYLEALLGGLILDPWEIRKRLRECEKREVATARRAGRALLDRVTEESLGQQLVEAEQLDAEIGSRAPSLLLRAGEAAQVVRRRIEVFPQIKAGKMDHLPPIVQVRTLHPLGRDLPISPGGRLKVEWSREAIEHGRLDAAALVSVPAWYPDWLGAKLGAICLGQKP